MKSVYDLLISIASELENPDNDIYIAAENNDNKLSLTAEICCQAALILRNGAEEVKNLESCEEVCEEDCDSYGNKCCTCECVTDDGNSVKLNKYTYCIPCAKEELDKLSNKEEDEKEDEVEKLASNLEDVVKLANLLDATNDPELIKKASALDELLQTLYSPNKQKEKIKEAAKIKEIQERMKNAKNQNGDMNQKVGRELNKLNSNSQNNRYRPLEHPLSMRTCPDHYGAQIAKLSDDVWQCSIDHKIYDFKNGFITMTGKFVPGTSIENQTAQFGENKSGDSENSTRYSRLGLNG